MKKKFKVTLYQEMYRDIIIEADSEEEAKDLVMSGEFNEEDIDDVTVKDSDIIIVKTLD